MLSYDKERLIPLCPKCKKELKEIQAKSFNTNYYEFDFETREYRPMPGTKVEDDNLFHCSECGYGIEVKELFDTLVKLTVRSNTVKAA